MANQTIKLSCMIIYLIKIRFTLFCGIFAYICNPSMILHNTNVDTRLVVHLILAQMHEASSRKISVFETKNMPILIVLCILFLFPGKNIH